MMMMKVPSAFQAPPLMDLEFSHILSMSVPLNVCAAKFLEIWPSLVDLIELYLGVCFDKIFKLNSGTNEGRRSFYEGKCEVQ